MVPELLMGNRVLRTFDKDGNGALRIQFRDDDGSPLRLNTAGLFLIQTTTFNTLSRGIYIGGTFFCLILIFSYKEKGLGKKLIEFFDYTATKLSSIMNLSG